MSLTVVGLDGAALPPGAAQALAEAKVVIGAAHHLAAVAVPTEATILGTGELDELDEVSSSTPTVVLASGDPGFFGIVRALRERGLRPVVLPARSSVARAFALLGRPWDDVAVVSAHSRSLRSALNVCRAHPAVAVLTGPGTGAAEIVAGLAGWHRSVFVAEDLGGPHERVRRFGGQVSDPHVVLCLADEDAVPARGWIAGGESVPPAAGWALDEAQFSHRAGMITKSEVRALVLARLAPGPGRLVWDLGAGSGSVGIECARLGAAVVAVERDPAQCARLVANAHAHGVDVRVVEGTAPAVLDGLPEPDAVFVGGGGPEVVRIAAQAAPRVVVTLAALDRLAPCRAALREADHHIGGVQLAASRFAELPDGSMRLAATNPVLLLWGSR